MFEGSFHDGREPGKIWGFILRNWRQSDWLSSLTWIGIGLLVFLHLICFAAIAISRMYYGESFNPILFAQFIEARKGDVWNPFQPAPEGPGAPPPAPAPVQTATLLSSQTNQVAGSSAAANDWMQLSEEERQLVRARKIQLAQNTMRDAERKWLLGQQRDALDSLHKVLDEIPDYVPLVSLMAGFYQETGDLSKASFFWEKVKLLSDANSQEWQAAKEHLAKLQIQEQRSKSSGEARAPVGAGKLRVVRVSEKRPGSQEDLYDLLINLEITLSANLSEPTVDAQQTRIEILFFDQYRSASGVLLLVRTLSQSIRSPASWSSRENESLSVTYSVPRGYWRNRLKAYGKSYDFCGYVVRVYYRGEFQDAAWNQNLLLPWRTPIS